MLNTTTDVFVDWVTALGTVARTNTFMGKFFSLEKPTPTARAYHREIAYQYYPSGVRFYLNRDDLDSENIVVMDGAACSHLRDSQSNEWLSKFAGVLARSCSHFTRIDLAVDIMDGGEFAQSFALRMETEVYRAGRRKVTCFRDLSSSGGCTTYIGSRSSPKMIRIYDKLAESKGRIPSSRIELEIKAEAALAYHDTLRRFAGWKTLPGLFNGTLLEMIDLEGIPELEALAYGEVRTIRPLKRERHLETKEWLRRQVMPTFRRDYEGVGAELWSWFKAEVERTLPD